jgi:hypothetical protein
MPVTKYRRVEDMPETGQRSDVDLATRIRTLWARAFLLSPPTPRRGVQRFRSITEANDERARATASRMKKRAAPGSE